MSFLSCKMSLTTTHLCSGFLCRGMYSSLGNMVDTIYSGKVKDMLFSQLPLLASSGLNFLLSLSHIPTIRTGRRRGKGVLRLMLVQTTMNRRCWQASESLLKPQLEMNVSENPQSTCNFPKVNVSSI